MRILLIGGSGMLGTELLKLNPDMMAPARRDLDITKGDANFFIRETKPDVVILAAAVTDNRAVEKNPTEALEVNIAGTANVAIACIKHGVRLIYLSTDYIYPGDHGNYRETDPIQPFNLYAWTKLGGECSVKAVPNHLIIRTSFGANEFPYHQAFTDKWTSKDYVDHIAPLIYEAAISPLTGVLNLGTSRKTLFSHAYERNKSVDPVKLSESNFNTPYDTSMNLQKWFDYKSHKSIAKSHTECRVCGSKDLVKYLDLGLMPLANNLEFTAVAAKEKERFPLQVMFCKECALSQLSVVIDPEKMFSHYVYRSGVNGGYVEHCKEMMRHLYTEYLKDTGNFHIDIAGNDGTLLLQSLKAYDDLGFIDGLQILNVDPASNLTAIAEQAGVPSRTDFWSSDLAEIIVERYSWASLITATNVFAHLDNVKDFMQGCRIALSGKGILVIENPYLIDTIENMEFDQVYFEHTQYWSVLPMYKICEDNDLELIDVQKQNIHGGTMRYIIAKKDSGRSIRQGVQEAINAEVVKGYREADTYLKWSDQVKEVIKDFGWNLLRLKKTGVKIAAFAASAKGNTLLNAAKINTDIIDFISDQTPEKIGKFSPGTGIPILGMEAIMKQKPDYVVILSWNFQDEIIGKVRATGYTGKFIIPIPKFTIID